MMASFLRTRGQGARVSVEGFEGSTDPVARSDGRLWDRGRDHARDKAFSLRRVGFGGSFQEV